MYILFIKHIFALVFSFLFAFYLMPLMIKAAHRLRFFDHPDAHIKVHTGAVPYLGGVGVFIAFLATIGLVYPVHDNILWFIVGVTLLLFVGLIDDLVVLSPLEKFGGQILAVLCFLKGGISLRWLFFSAYSNIALSSFWMLSIINAFNLVDVMDGLSSLLALVAASSFLFLALVFKHYTLSLLFLAFIGPLLAFFLYNKPPAKIYLGDAGALFVGGFLAATPLLFSWSTVHLEGCLAPLIIMGVPLLILGIPLFEIATLIIIRTMKGIPFYRGSPHHFSLYLKRKNWPIPYILLFTGGASVFLSVIACLFLFNKITFWQTFIVLCFFALAWLYHVFYKK